MIFYTACTSMDAKMVLQSYIPKAPIMPPLRLQSSEGKFTTSREIEPVRMSFRRRRSCTFTEVARLVPSGYSHVYMYVVLCCTSPRRVQMRSAAFTWHF